MKNELKDKEQRLRSQGLINKYYIQKVEPNPKYNDLRKRTISTPEFILKPVDKDSEYFVLRLDEKGSDPIHIEACRKAVRTYANEIKSHIPKLAEDLFNRYEQYRQPDNKAVDKQKLAVDLRFIYNRYDGSHHYKLLDSIIEYFTPLIQSPPKSISDRKSDAVEFLVWAATNGYDARNMFANLSFSQHPLKSKEYSPNELYELFKQFKTDAK